jgi:hypothetical protein
MVALRRARSFALVCAFVLAGLGASAFESFLPHTDDGCPVEVHCLVCQRVQGATPEAPRVVLVAVSFEVVGAPALAVPSDVSAPCLRAAFSRGPPPAPASAQV